MERDNDFAERGRGRDFATIKREFFYIFLSRADCVCDERSKFKIIVIT